MYIYVMYILIMLLIMLCKYIYVSTELHFWLNVWVPLATLSINLLGKYPFFN